MAAPRKILICEDEDAIREFEVINLQRSGYEVVDVSCGEDAIRVFDEQGDSFSVAILDIMMPGIDGFEVLRAVKKTNPEVQVIILTGHGGDAEEASAFRMGAYSFLRKPMDIDDLLNCIRLAYRDRIEKPYVAAAMAEGGDFDSAREVMREKDLMKDRK